VLMVPSYVLVLFPWLACDPDDLSRFPNSSTCNMQLLRCAEHKERLRCLRGVHGWQGGRWDDVLAELDFARRYWLCLLWCHDLWSSSPTEARKRLLLLKELIGPTRYLKGWRPPEIPETARFWLAVPLPAEMLPANP
jgi:hypothetical protein